MPDTLKKSAPARPDSPHQSARELTRFIFASKPRGKAGALNQRRSELMLLAVQAFGGDMAKLHRWLNRPNRALGGRKPGALLRTEEGQDELDRVITSILYGLPS